ncbi:MAG: hypothetical protein ACRDZ5_10600 [Acidimicrobiales bacterium]
MMLFQLKDLVDERRRELLLEATKARQTRQARLAGEARRAGGLVRARLQEAALTVWLVATAEPHMVTVESHAKSAARRANAKAEPRANAKAEPRATAECPQSSLSA